MQLRFREEKATQAAVHLLRREGGRMSHMKLIKLLYLVDRTALVRWGRPVTFDWYFSLPHGPVLSFTLDLINTEPDPKEPSYWHRFISERKGHEVEILNGAPSDQLSQAEEQLLDEIYGQFGGMNQWELRDYSHKLREWRDPEGSRLSIDLRDILFAEGMSEADVKEVEDALQAEASAQEILG